VGYCTESFCGNLIRRFRTCYNAAGSVSANLTPDQTSGLADWSDAEIERAIRTGIACDGHKLFPPMPFGAYQNFAADDMVALITYLRSLPAVE
jgi:hypothetical protein